MGEVKRARMNQPLAVLLVGVGLLVAGLLLAGMPGLMVADAAPPPGSLGHTAGGLALGPLGIALLTSGVALGGGVVGYLFGSRQRTAEG